MGNALSGVVLAANRNDPACMRLRIASSCSYAETYSASAGWALVDVAG